MKVKRKLLKVRIYPNKTSKEFLEKTFGANRFMWNVMLAERKEIYERLKGDRRALYEYKYKTEAEIKQQHPWLTEVDAVSLVQTNNDLSQAYQNFFRTVNKKSGQKWGLPKFKKKHAKQSYRTCNSKGNVKCDFENHKIKLPKLKCWIPFRDSRVIENGKLKNITVSKTKTGKYFASMLFEVEIPENSEVAPKSKDELKIKGLDMSLTNFFVDDEGNSPCYDHLFRLNEQKIANLQRLIDSSKSKVFKRRMRNRLNRLYEKLTNKRKDFIEKLSTQLVRENDVIVIESLSMKDIAKVRKTEDGKWIKHGKSVNELGWYQFTVRLKQKAEEHGVQIIEANKWFASSQTCNVCGYRYKDITISEREWCCPQCGTSHLRDVNAAINLKKLGEGTFL